MDTGVKFRVRSLCATSDLGDENRREPNLPRSYSPYHLSLFLKLFWFNCSTWQIFFCNRRKKVMSNGGRRSCRIWEMRAYMLPPTTALWRKRPSPSLGDSDPIFWKRRLMASSSPIASGRQKISILASVRNGRSPSRSDAKRKRSTLDRTSERGITDFWNLWAERTQEEKLSIYERSELGKKYQKILFFENSSTGKIGFKKFYI